MPKAVIDVKKCLRCNPCSAAEAYPVKAIEKIEPDEPPAIDISACFGCGECVEDCKEGAIWIEKN